MGRRGIGVLFIIYIYIDRKTGRKTKRVEKLDNIYTSI